jgi:hypothetical protein
LVQGGGSNNAALPEPLRARQILLRLFEFCRRRLSLLAFLLSATAWKRAKTGKMKMVRFSGIKFAAGLAYETLNPLPSHEIRRTRIRRQIFSTDAKKKIVHFQIAGIDAVLGRR